MKTPLCPIELNRLLQWTDGNGEDRRYRLVAFDARRGRLAFSPLDAKGATRDDSFPLVAFPVDQIAREMACGRLVEIPETEEVACTRRHAAKLAPADVERWATRRAMIAALLEIGQAESRRMGIPDTNALFFEPALFTATVAFVSDRFRQRPARVKRLVVQWLRQGADDLAIIPRTGQRKASKLIPRNDRLKQRPGRRSAYEILHQCTLGRFNEFWRARVMAAIVVARVESDTWGKAWIRLRQCKRFYADMRSRFSHVPGHLDDADPPRIAAIRLPSADILNRHKRAMLKDLREEIFPPATHSPTGGNATDLCNGRLVIWDMDATVLEFIDIVVEADGKRIVVGPPTLILVVERRSNCIVGWFLTVRPESSLCYCYALYNALTDKGPRLRQLGFEETPQGIVSGDCDGAFIDRGPGRGHQFVRMTADELDIDLTWGRTRVPEDKGDVEEAGGLVKRRVRDEETDLENTWLIQQTRAAVKAKTAMFPTGVITTERLIANRTERRHGKAPDRIEATLRGCERMVVDAIAQINAAWKSDRSGLTLGMQVRRVPNTRVGIHTAMQEARRGNARAPRSETSLLWATLPKHYHCKLRRGVIRKDNVVYGGNREDDCGCEAAAALAEYAKQWQLEHPNDLQSPTVAPFLIPPYGNCALWVRGEEVVVIPARGQARECYGEDVDLEIIEFLNLDFNSEKRAYEIKGDPKPPVMAGRTAQEASKRILAAVGSPPTAGAATVKMAARRHAQHAEDVSHFNEVAGKVGLPTDAPAEKAARPGSADTEMELKDAVIRPRVIKDVIDG